MAFSVGDKRNYNENRVFLDSKRQRLDQRESPITLFRELKDLGRIFDDESRVNKYFCFLENGKVGWDCDIPIKVCILKDMIETWEKIQIIDITEQLDHFIGLRLVKQLLHENTDSINLKILIQLNYMFAGETPENKKCICNLAKSLGMESFLNSYLDDSSSEDVQYVRLIAKHLNLL